MICSARRRLGFQPLFITIDPERDSAGAMQSYIEALDARIIALTGNAAEVAAVAGAYKVYYKKSPANADDPGSYLMDHTAFVYVVGPEGSYVTLFAPRAGQGPGQMAARLRELFSQSPESQR